MDNINELVDKIDKMKQAEREAFLQEAEACLDEARQIIAQQPSQADS